MPTPQASVTRLKAMNSSQRARITDLEKRLSKALDALEREKGNSDLWRERFASSTERLSAAEETFTELEAMNQRLKAILSAHVKEIPSGIFAAGLSLSSLEH